MSESDPTLSEQDRQCIPRLRRTKNLLLQMKGQIDFDSDELFDPTSDDSGEEYIPKSGEDSSEDTDTTEIIVSVDQKMNMLRFPNIGKRVDVRNDDSIPEGCGRKRRLPLWKGT
ncbi:hypothetical protein PAMP_022911 [Pampus punctatissimus]